MLLVLQFKKTLFARIVYKIMALASDAYSTFISPTLSMAYCILMVSPTPTPVVGCDANFDNSFAQNPILGLLFLLFGFGKY